MHNAAVDFRLSKVDLRQCMSPMIGPVSSPMPKRKSQILMDNGSSMRVSSFYNRNESVYRK